MYRLSSVVAVVALWLLPSGSLKAWSSAGHMVIAGEAYGLLSPKLKTKVTEILKAHPEYEKWQASFKAGDVDLDTFIFMRASTWPDEIRRDHAHYDHPKWHYINYPLRPPSFPAEAGSSPEDDILYGIGQAEKELADSHSSQEEQAVYLSWLIHLVGDLHQPLHCSSLFNEAYPKGDKGGNDFYVKPGSRGIRLHSFWDGLLGTSGRPQAHLSYGVEIETRYPRKSLKELKKHKTVKAWSLEGRDLAVEKVYLRGELKGAAIPEEAPPLPEGYTKEAKVVAERQAALAGYRLADEVQKFMK
jgi:hypothetical protein